MTAADLREKHMQSISDDVGLAAGGDTAAFARLVKANEGMLYRVSRATLRSDADASDAVQEAVITAWRRIGQLRSPESFPAWLAKICINRCYRATQTKKARISIEEPQTSIQCDTKLDVITAIEGLPKELRPTVVLYYFEDWNIRDIARATGTLEGTVKSRLHRARKLLFVSLKGYKEETSNGAG